jgi:hypothetical protein
LHEARVATKIGDLEVDAMLFENTGCEADVGGQESEILRLRLAEANFYLRRRVSATQRHSADCERQT